MISCQQGKDTALQNYTENELIEILIDVSLARSAVSGWPASLADSVKQDHYQIISQLYGIEEGELYRILENLSHHPEYFQKLLNTAADSLRIRNDRVGADD
jgi:hypothetical protein